MAAPSLTVGVLFRRCPSLTVGVLFRRCPSLTVGVLFRRCLLPDGRGSVLLKAEP